MGGFTIEEKNPTSQQLLPAYIFLGRDGGLICLLGLTSLVTFLVLPQCNVNGPSLGAIN